MAVHEVIASNGSDVANTMSLFFGLSIAILYCDLKNTQYEQIEDIYNCGIGGRPCCI